MFNALAGQMHIAKKLKSEPTATITSEEANTPSVNPNTPQLEIPTLNPNDIGSFEILKLETIDDKMLSQILDATEKELCEEENRQHPIKNQNTSTSTPTRRTPTTPTPTNGTPSTSTPPQLNTTITTHNSSNLSSIPVIPKMFFPNSKRHP